MTRTFAERQLCKVRGVFRAITRPVAIQNISLAIESVKEDNEEK